MKKAHVLEISSTLFFQNSTF